jgi:hypothetical protein
MSKIKDLYAEAEGIEDLMPVQSAKERIQKVLLAKAHRFMNLEDWLYERVEWSFGYDEEGHLDVGVANLDQLANEAANDLVDGYIEDEHYDMSDEMYSELIDWLGDKLADEWESMTSTLVERKIEDDKEAWAQHNSFYNDHNLGIKK